MKRKPIYILGLYAMLTINCCNEKCNVNNIEVSELLKAISDDNKINYCNLLEKAVRGNNNSIRELSLLYFENAAGYDHGNVLVSLILKIGEEGYIQAIKPLTKKQKYNIKAYLEVGIEYGDHDFINKQGLEEIFPKINKYLIE